MLTWGSLIIIVLLAAAIILIAMCFARAIAKRIDRHRLSSGSGWPLETYGDVARLPEEAVALGNSRGGASDRPSTTVTRTIKGHDLSPHAGGAI